jgi:TPR repeat protein
MGATYNDLEALKSIQPKVRAEIMYTYLCGQGYNMQDVARIVLGDTNEQAGKRVSCVMRCYGFEGNNSGKYKGKVTKEDILLYIQNYPNGDLENNFILFLQRRIDERNREKARSEQVERQKRQQQQENERLRRQEEQAERERRARQEAEWKEQERQRLVREQREAEERRRQQLENEKTERRARELKLQADGYRSGKNGFPKNLAKAIALYEEIAGIYWSGGYYGGQCSLNVEEEYLNSCYTYGSELYSIGEYDKAILYYQKILYHRNAGIYGDLKAHTFYNMGLIYSNKAYPRSHPVKAAEYIIEAANLGMIKACEMAGKIFEDGTVYGKDREKAMHYYLAAMETDHYSDWLEGKVFELRRQIEEEELDYIDSYLKNCPDYFEVAIGNCSSWEEYQEKNRINMDKFWAEYQKTLSSVETTTHFILFKKKHYTYQGVLSIEEFNNACKKEWARRQELYGTKDYVCTEAESKLIQEYLRLGQENYEATNYDMAAYYLKLPASIGYEDSKWALTSIYYEHKKDYQRAFVFAEELAKVEYAKAQYLLSLGYLNQHFPDERAVEKAYLWCKKACDNGMEQAEELMVSVKESCLRKAQDYLSGTNGVGVKIERAVSLYELIGSTDTKEYFTACASYGRYLSNCFDVKNAVIYLTRAAEGGNAEAKYFLSQLYQEGRGVEKNITLALQLLKEAADASHPEAVLAMAEHYFYGDGIEKNLSLAIEYYECCTIEYDKMNYYRACFGYALECKGLYGETEDVLRLYRIAAEGGEAKAQNNLGLLYWRGNVVARDLSEAIFWLTAAAEQSVGKACKNLGNLYADEEIVRDYEKSLEFLEMAYNLGEDVLAKMEQVQSKLSEQKEKKSLHHKALNAYKQGEYEEALDLLEQLHEANPEDDLYDTLLINCLEGCDEDMTQRERHRKLAFHYIEEKLVDVAWEHYLAAELEDELYKEETITGDNEDGWDSLDLGEQEDTAQRKVKQEWILAIEFAKELFDCSEDRKPTLAKSIEKLLLKVSKKIPDFLNTYVFPEDEALHYLRDYMDLLIQCNYYSGYIAAAASLLEHLYFIKGTEYQSTMLPKILAEINAENDSHRNIISLMSIWMGFENYSKVNGVNSIAIDDLMMRYVIKNSDYLLSDTEWEEDSYTRFNLLGGITAVTQETKIQSELYQIYEKEITYPKLSYDQFYAVAIERSRRISYFYSEMVSEDIFISYAKHCHPMELKSYYEFNSHWNLVQERSKVYLRELLDSCELGKVGCALESIKQLAGDDEDNVNWIYTDLEEVVAKKAEELIADITLDVKPEELDFMIWCIRDWPAEHCLNDKLVQLLEKRIKQTDECDPEYYGYLAGLYWAGDGVLPDEWKAVQYYHQYEEMHEAKLAEKMKRLEASGDGLVTDEYENEVEYTGPISGVDDYGAVDAVDEFDTIESMDEFDTISGVDDYDTIGTMGAFDTLYNQMLQTLGQAYLYGKGIERNVAKAGEYFNKLKGSKVKDAKQRGADYWLQNVKL